MIAASPLWRKDRHADRRPRLLARARAASCCAADSRREGFIEVEPATLQVSPGNETHLHAFATEMIGRTASVTRLISIRRRNLR